MPSDFKLNCTLKVIQGHPYWCQQKPRTAGVALFSASTLQDEKLIKKQTYTKTEACKLYSRVFWIFLTNVMKIDPYNFELYRFKVGAFFLRHIAMPKMATLFWNLRRVELGRRAENCKFVDFNHSIPVWRHFSEKSLWSDFISLLILLLLLLLLVFFLLLVERSLQKAIRFKSDRMKFGMIVLQVP